MNNINPPDRFPKVRPPYQRHESEEDYWVVEDVVPDRFSWVFDRASEVDAVEKLHGTNVAIHLSESSHGGYTVDAAAERRGDRTLEIIDPFMTSSQTKYITRGIQNSVQRGSYIDHVWREFGEGWYFGELVGPRIHKNPYDMDEHLFVPFDWLREKASYRSYGKYGTNFSEIRDWFEGRENGLASLFNSMMHSVPLEESRPDAGQFVEGIIFVHPDHEGPISLDAMNTYESDLHGGSVVTDTIAKLRRDMFVEHARGEWPQVE